MAPERSWPDLLLHLKDLETRLAVYEGGNGDSHRATDAARLVEESRENEHRLQQFIENMPAAVAMFDRGMRYLAVSRRWRLEYLRGTESVLGQSHYKLFPECPERWRAAHAKGMAGEIVRVAEDRWTHADGSDLWVRYEVSPWYTVDDRIGGIIIYREDITKQKAAEEVARLGEQRFRTLANAIPQLCWMAHADGWIYWYNERWYAYTGTTPEQMKAGGGSPCTTRRCWGRCSSAGKRRW